MTCTPEMSAAATPEPEYHDWDGDFSVAGLQARTFDAYRHDAETRARASLAEREARVREAEELASEAAAMAIRKFAEEQAQQQLAQ